MIITVGVLSEQWSTIKIDWPSSFESPEERITCENKEICHPSA